VKADDLGVRLAQRNGAISGPLGRALVYGMPPFLELLSLVGMLAMLWVGGGILVHGLAEFGIAQPEHFIHAIAEWAAALMPAGGDVIAWIVTATGAGIVGLVAGAITAAVWAVVGAPFRKAKPEAH
jgi:predicted DNA repair protein MutK